MRAAVGESPRLFYFTIKIIFYFFQAFRNSSLRVSRNSRFGNSRFGNSSLRVYRNSSLGNSRIPSLV